MKVRFEFMGRRVGAIGIFYPVTREVECENTDLETVRDAFYKSGYSEKWESNGVIWNSIQRINDDPVPFADAGQ